MTDSLEQTILQETPLKTLAHLKSEETESYALGISNEIGTTYGYTHKVIKKFEEQGLVTTEKKSRKNIITLTQEGEILAEKAEALLEGVQAVEEKRVSEAQ